MADKKSKGGMRPDIASIAGLLLAFGGILVGLMLDGGKISDVVQVNAALIVLGGTIGAVMVTSPPSALIHALKSIGTVFFAHSHSAGGMIEEIIEYATQARKQGIVSLEQQANSISDPFLRKALNLAVDGIDMDQIRDVMEREIEVVEQEGEAAVKVFEAAGGYAPTIGIIGAVLGLMQVMKHLADIEEVGRGIAAAFVATVYGVAVANLFFLPAAGKLKARCKEAVHMREITLDGVLAIVEGLNPKLIRTKLEAYDKTPSKAAKKEKAGAARTAAAEA